ncbi:MAG: aldehyde dehydrogenase family protein, partial [Alphaproteobacteria bacterium]|nr:aldehyde dehydrogenase family protein [Alphaproteobacteria bacterium]
MSKHLKFFIDGAWVDPIVPAVLDVSDPATEEPFTTISVGAKADVDRAVAAAKAAFTSFSQTDRAERLALLERILEAYNARFEDIAQAVSREMGAPLDFARDSQAWAGRAHLEATIGALKAAGHRVSVDSANPDELSRATRAGADYLLSLTEETLEIAREGDAVPILVPAVPHDMGSLDRAIDKAKGMGIDFIADAILDPIHFGFSASLVRYHELRRRHPDISILMGTGNLTELTDADTSGITATLLGICSELSIDNLLIVHVSPHTRATIAEHDAARRMLFAAREDNALPRGYSNALLQVHDVNPFAATPDELRELAATIKDR